MHIVSTQKRPRVLDWFHAGPLLFGDWGTSRLYVLGLAFYYTGHASVLYLAAMSLIMVAVAWAYTIVCRSFPEGGGVYAAARPISPTLSVVGATLLLCGYIITASLSAVVAFHYFGVPKDLTVVCCLITLAGIGLVNWLGARSAGRFALLIAFFAVIVSFAIALMSLPLLGAGLRTVSLASDQAGTGPGAWLTRWESLVMIVLALSGVESVANMTGLMKEPVRRTSRRTIWPVLIEVVLLNMIFGIALNALPALEHVARPDYLTHQIERGLPSDQIPADVQAYRDTAVKLLAEHSAGTVLPTGAARAFSLVAAGVFALLLLSAVNTAVMVMVSVLYSMSHDGELPRPLTKLNYSGVPWAGLIVSCALPAVVLLVIADAEALAGLYAVGVVGAIAINFLCCAASRTIAMAGWERAAMWALGGVMSAVEITVVLHNPDAAVFAGVMLFAVLTTRYFIRIAGAKKAHELALPVPAHGWLAELQQDHLPIQPGMPRIMLAARGRGQAEFAIDLARKRGAALFAIYVRTLRVMDVAPGAIPKIEDDPDAIASLGSIAALARRYGVPFVPVYVSSSQIAEEILDYTVTFGCDTLIMGKTRRRAFARVVQGDVIAQVASHLPDEVALITRDSSPHDLGPPPEGHRQELRREAAPPTGGSFGDGRPPTPAVKGPSAPGP